VEPYNGKSLLEIGTLVGYSASLMAQACPTSSIITLNHAGHKVKEAIINLKNYRNVQVLCKVSWDYYNEYKGPDFGAIFVDGDHVRVARDLV
jgi:predicted O-methyltransferase YrrM